jgi:hypothetical protein
MQIVTVKGTTMKLRFQVLTAGAWKLLSCSMLRRTVWQKFADVSEMPATSSITAMMMEEAPLKRR